MPKREELLSTSEHQPFEVMWANEEYRKFAVVKFRYLIQLLEITERILTINAANIFSAENGHPENVSYPPIRIAEGISVDGMRYLEGAKDFSAYDRLRRYKFEVYPVESLKVKVIRTGEEIQTAKVMFSVGWT